MKNSKVRQLLFACCCSLFAGCNMATPENYFDEAVLNCNMMTGFASDGMLLQLKHPSAKLVPGTKDQTEPMKRSEVIGNNLQYLEESFKKLKKLDETADTKPMLQAAVAVYEYVLPVYRNEYLQLAKLYDEGAPETAISQLSQTIQDSYFSGFEERLSALTAAGKPYAARHNINVKWDVNTSPSP